MVPIAAEDSRYVSDWIVVTLEHAIATYDPTDPYHRHDLRGNRTKKEYREQRLIFRVPASLHHALVEVAEREDRSISRWISNALERAIAERAALKKSIAERKP